MRQRAVAIIPLVQQLFAQRAIHNFKMSEVVAGAFLYFLVAAVRDSQVDANSIGRAEEPTS